jgi:hypothetical protein
VGDTSRTQQGHGLGNSSFNTPSRQQGSEQQQQLLQRRPNAGCQASRLVVAAGESSIGAILAAAGMGGDGNAVAAPAAGGEGNSEAGAGNS